jgi:hypothetical protein
MKIAFIRNVENLYFNQKKTMAQIAIIMNTDVSVIDLALCAGISCDTPSGEYDE